MVINPLNLIMEQPYAGRAIVNNNVDTLEVIIPSKKNWFVICFTCIWLCAWALGELFGLSMLLGLFSNPPFGLFMIVWLSGWTLGGSLALRGVIWGIAGKEIIAMGNGVLTIKKKNDIFSRAKTYNLNDVKSIRVLDATPEYSFWNRGTNAFGLTKGGNIRFDYGMQTIKFAIELDEAEANYLVEQMNAKYPTG